MWTCLKLVISNSDPEFIITRQFTRQNKNVTEQVAKWDKAVRRLKIKPDRNGLE